MSTAAAKVGGGLVEISAVATIIGAPIAEMLIHGLKGACSMVYAPMSTFGAIHVTKACLAAAIPDHLREAMGLRNGHVDAAIGVFIPVDPSRKARSRVDLGDAIAIQSISTSYSSVSSVLRTLFRRRPMLPSSRHSVASLDSSLFQTPENSHRTATGIYVLDRNSQLSLDTVYATGSEKGEAVKIHRFEPDMAGLAPAWQDWVVLWLSLVKLTEAFALWKLGAHYLWFWTCLGWAHAFITANILQVFGLGRDDTLRSTNDIVAGKLPTPLHLGGQGKIVLHIPANVRRHLLWRTLLGVGVIFNAAGLFGTFLFLGKESSIVIYVWVGFQVLWLVSRTVVFYFVEGAAAARQGVTTSTTWDLASDEERQRVLTLLANLAKHQVSIHPRGVLAYRQDCLSFHEVSSRFEQIDWEITMNLPKQDSENRVWSINIKAAAGDNLVRSAVWFTGADLNNSELYDATVAFINMERQNFAVPCVRVWMCDCLPDTDRSRGNAHPDCGMVKWMYFIPFTSAAHDGWVLAHGLSATGLLMSELLSNEELDVRLRNGRYRISIQNIEELKQALEVSRSGVTIVRDLVKTAVNVRKQLPSVAISKSSAGISVETTEVSPSSMSPI